MMFDRLYDEINQIEKHVESLRKENKDLKAKLAEIQSDFELCGICSREVYPKDRCICSENNLR